MKQEIMDTREKLNKKGEKLLNDSLATLNPQVLVSNP